MNGVRKIRQFTSTEVMTVHARVPLGNYSRIGRRVDLAVLAWLLVPEHTTDVTMLDRLLHRASVLVTSVNYRTRMRPQ
jgi:hypothetical protein